MFVRFRERKSGGVRPALVDALILCEGGCADRTDGHRHRCYMKPRCRWHVGARQNLELEPYRLLVSLIENRRTNGIVKQETVAELGAIDGHLLPGFYAGIDPAIVEQITADEAGPALPIERNDLVFLCRSWQRASLDLRIKFWQNLHEVLSRLSNRIDAATAHKIMDAINARIPLPPIDEIERTPLRRAEDGLASAEDSRASSLQLVKSNKELAAAAERSAEGWQQDANLQAEKVALWRAEIDRLRKTDNA